MKKGIVKCLVCILSIIILFSTVSLITGCDDNFIYVRDITFTTNGETITKKSYYHDNYSQTPITEEEFMESPINDRVYFSADNKPIITSKAMLPSKEDWGKVSYSTKNKSQGTLKYISVTGIHPPITTYYKGYYEGRTYYFVIVKIIDNATLEIKDTTGTTVYTVSSYKIRELT